MEFEPELLLGAEIDFLEIYSRRGDVFYEQIDIALSRLRRFPEVGPLYSTPFRRMLIPKTPFGMFYTVEGRRIVIAAILDLRMDPGRIGDRLKRQ
jgi:plasmid stabilization system protein ParE